MIVQEKACLDQANDGKAPENLTMKTIKFLSVLVFSILCACTVSPEQKNAFVLINGLLIDGTGSNPLPNAVVVIQGEWITAIGSNATVEIPRGASIVDLKGATILPGFINAHVHYAFDNQNLKAWVNGGVTTVRDEGIVSSSALDTLLVKQRTVFCLPPEPLQSLPAIVPLLYLAARAA